MNYKYLSKLDLKYTVLSTFQRGLFWGTIVSWTAVVSGVFGATATKIFYVDRKNLIVAQNYATFEDSELLTTSSNIKEPVNFAIANLGEYHVESQVTGFSFVTCEEFISSNNYRFAANISLIESFERSKFFPSFDFSIITAFDSSLLTSQPELIIHLEEDTQFNTERNFIN